MSARTHPQSNTSQRQRLVDDSLRILEQGRELLSGLSPELHAQPEKSVASSGIGSHFRHVIEYFELFVQGLQSGTGRIDYDLRRRDERVERDPAYALERLTDLEAGLRETLSANGGDDALLIKADAVSEAPEDVPWARSSIERELQFLSSHAVHHYALIAVILRLNGEEPSAEFGVAPSTLRHWRESGTCAR
ncbi:MAG: DinB family protein [Planctomycetota bacterium]